MSDAIEQETLPQSDVKPDNNKTFLGNISVVWRIGFLVVLGVVGLLVLGSISWWGSDQVEDAISAEENFASIEISVLEANNGALLLRRREKDFLLRKDLKYREGYIQDHAQTIEQLNTLQTIPEAASMSENINAIIAKLNEHKTQFLKVVDMTNQMGLNEKEGLQGSLRNAVRDVETKLKEFNLDALTVKMLMMRRHEKDFMLRGADKYLGRIDTRRQEFDVLLTATDMMDADKSAISTLLDRYQAEMRTFGALSMALKPEIKRLSAIYKEMAEPANTLRSFAKENLERTKEHAHYVKNQTKTLLLTSSVIITVILVVLGVLVMRSLTGPLARITRATTDLADGQRNVQVPATGNTDEVGAMAQALLVFQGNLEESERLRIEREEAERQSVEQQRQSRLDMASQFEDNVGSIVSSVSDAATGMQSSAQNLSETAKQTSVQSQTVAAAAEEASSNVQTVASAAEELSSSISEISRQVSQSTQIAGSAVAEVEGANEKVQGLADAANKIGEVVALITDIADQTNLLALNATIEAARAGEAGKGFAVVASEVKNLANQTAKATEDISSQIGGIQSATQDAVQAIGSIGGIINQMNEIASTIAAAVEEQGAATQEIARNVEQAAAGTGEVSSNITGVNQAAGDTGQSAEQLLSAAIGLSKQSEGLTREMQTFLDEVRKG